MSAPEGRLSRSVGALVLAGGLVAGAITQRVLGALGVSPALEIAALALAAVGLGIVRRDLRALRAQRAEKLFFDAIAALRSAAPEASERLAALAEGAADQADAWLLLSAAAAGRGRHDDALHAVERAVDLAPTVGALSGGFSLRFPGLPRPLRFDRRTPPVGPLRRLRGHLLSLSGNPRAALDLLASHRTDPDYLTSLSALADARAAVGDHDRAKNALRTAIRAAVREGREPALERFFRYKLARQYEAKGAWKAAIEEYERVLAAGGHEDAAARLAALLADSATRRAKKASAREESAFDRALRRLASAAGPRGRRAAIEAGLRALTRPELRERLLDRAAQVEVRATIERVETLKTTSAKRRCLREAIDTLRADGVDDLLQEASIEMLERMLARLGEGTS